MTLQKNPTLLEVVAAALIDDQGRVLLQQRPAAKHHGGLWEFPGGKVEPGEAKVEALVREIGEELALTLQPADLRLLATAQDQVAGLAITLFTCQVWAGAPQCLDAQALAWFAPTDLPVGIMPPLDIALAKALTQQSQEP